MKRIYVCHTYYHVFVTMLKELNIRDRENDQVTLVLSKMSNDFETLKERAEKSGVFSDVIEFDEKRETFFPELAKYKKDKGNIVLNMISRIIFTKKFAKLQEKYIPVDFKKYDDIYVFCDSDPIGYYLNRNRIRYHAMEDGLDSLKPCVLAIYDNRSCFAMKKFFSMNLNLIFIQDGYSKYCIDMEVNDKSVIDNEFHKYKEVNRNKLKESLSDADREILISVFIRDMDAFKSVTEKAGKNGILILTEPLCELDVRKQIFSDIIDMFKDEGEIFIKPHPRDLLDYNENFPQYWVFDRSVPMEVFGLFRGIRFKKVVSVYTQLGMIDFADEKVLLWHDFMDKYEAPEIHRKKEILDASMNRK